MRGKGWELLGIVGLAAMARGLRGGGRGLGGDVEGGVASLSLSSCDGEREGAWEVWQRQRLDEAGLVVIELEEG